jgi:surface carbohydrate biosynthesis protein
MIKNILHKIRKITFLKPKKKNILIFDKVGSETIEKSILNKKSFFILCSRYEELNLYILLKSIFLNIIKNKKKISYLGYLDIYIKTVKPKIVISLIDNNPIFFKLKNINPNIYFVCIQNGVSSSQMELSKFPKIKIDLFLCFSKYYAAYYKKYFAKKTEVIGSSKLNYFLKFIKKIQKHKTNNIVFISQFTKFDSWIIFGKKISKSLHFYPEKKVLPIIFRYCVKKKIKLIITFRSRILKNRILEEKNFYIDILRNEIDKTNIKYLSFVTSSDTYASYKTIAKSRLAVCIDSALGNEAMAINKVIHFPMRSKFMGKTVKFGWPKKLPSLGFFWLNHFSKNKIENILSKNYEMSQELWFRKLKKQNFDLLIFKDPDNLKLKSIINKYSNPTKK